MAEKKRKDNPEMEENKRTTNSGSENGANDKLNERKPGEEANAETREKAESGKTASEGEFAELNEKVDQLEEQLNEQNDKYLRLLAEFENYRKRTSRESLELRKNAAEDILSDLLPVLDDFDRAMKVIDDSGKDDSVAEGVKLVHNKLVRQLKSRGLNEMETDKADFDPDYHEALTEIPAPEKKLKGKIVDTVEKGYMLNDKIIRFAKVVVGK
jgi:molecular chaperone GrpE